VVGDSGGPEGPKEGEWPERQLACPCCAMQGQARTAVDGEREPGKGAGEQGLPTGPAEH
jgi:hypothetical protein